MSCSLKQAYRVSSCLNQTLSGKRLQAFAMLQHIDHSFSLCDFVDATAQTVAHLERAGLVDDSLSALPVETSGKAKSTRLGPLP